MRTYLLVMIVMLAGCGKEAKRPENPQEQMALGWITRTDIFNPQYPKFGESYDTMNVSSDFVGLIQLLGNSCDYIIVLGTWCSDSKREVPRFFKIADLAGIDSSRIKLYGVDRSKKHPGHVPEQYGIERVPTFIFLKNGKEVGRIVESPKNLLEAEMLAILADAQNR